MAIDLPNIKEIQQRIANALIVSANAGQTDSSKLIDPNIRNSGIKSLVNSMSAGFDENNDLINELIKQLFPQTSTDEFLEIWAAFFGITRKSAVKAQGNLVFTGTAGTSIASGTLIQKSDGTEYETQSTISISSSLINVSSITRIGTTATVTTLSNHNLASGITVTIAGADQAEYNLTTTISVTGANTFTYTVSGSPATPATGSITVAFTTASIPVIASEFGASGNSSEGSQLTLVSPIANVDNICTVDYFGLTLGSDLETDEELRIRLQERTANLTAPFTQAGLPVFIKEQISGITRIWIETATPSPGYVTIYFTRDNDSNIIPTAAQANEVKDAINDPVTGIKPANTPDNYVIVNPPTPVTVDFTFTSLSPNTAAMKEAITETLTDYFKSDSVNIATDIIENEYNSLIYSVVDADGNSPTFTLSSPSGTINLASGELAILGTITYP